METTAIKSKIREIIAGMFDVPPASVADERPFTEMAKYDSMRALEFLAKLETEFSVILDPDLLVKMRTVNMAAEVIEGLLHAS
jgi:acyl carrier protein